MSARNAPAYAGLIQWTRCRLTGHQYGLYRASEQGLEPWGGDYVTVCEDHSTTCNFETLAQARRFMASGDWCEECMAELDQRKTVGTDA